ncbi:hypothetical protein [Methylosoma difficile]
MTNRITKSAIISSGALGAVHLILLAANALVQYAKKNINTASELAYTAMDFLTPFILIRDGLLFASFLCASLSFWLVFRNREKLLSKKVLVYVIFSLAVTTSIATAFYGCILSLSFIGELWRENMCETSIYERSLSENGRYIAEVSMTDCGAVSSFHRKVTISRLPLTSFPMTALYLKGIPSINLEWKDRVLVIHGSRPLEEMERRPPEYAQIGGVMFHYVNDVVTNQ